jgi:predicted alpha/beta-fold hydrolase
MAQQASWRAGGRSKPGKNKSHHNTPRRHQQHIKKIKNAVKHLKDRPQSGGFLMVGNSLGSAIFW